MSSKKTALRSIAAALKAQKYDDALQQVQKLLTTEPNEYQAYVE